MADRGLPGAVVNTQFSFVLLLLGLWLWSLLAVVALLLLMFVAVAIGARAAIVGFVGTIMLDRALGSGIVVPQ